jgi:HAE1 family hydrophobic/amphiphilic exporter-1
VKNSSEFTSFVTSRPVAILMIFLAAVVFGYLSYGRLPVTLMPELTYPTLTVRTEYKGAAPEEVENDISRPIEEQLGVIAGLTKLSSVSRAGVSDVVLEFAWDTQMSDATQDVLERLDLVFLPDDAERPLILHYDPSLDPIMELSLSGQGKRFEGQSGLRRLRRLAELHIKKTIEPVKGVAAVRIRGGLEEEIHIVLEEEALRRTGIAIQTVIDRLAQENINVAGGTLKEGRTEYLVRTLNEYEGLDQIEETVVASFDGRNVRVRDLGRVRMSHKEREILTRTDGGESVQIEIHKEGDANIVSLAKRVKLLLGDPPREDEEDEKGAEGAGPMIASAGLAQQIFDEEGARLEVVADRSTFIESSINEVRKTAVLGGLLAVLILYLFIRSAKSTAIIAVSIPISLLITFAPLNLLGVSLNIMSLGGLALGIGMLVDSSIVVLESIYRCREEGDNEVRAANRGTTEVRSAVMASTLTSIAVFFPMVFVEGIAGQAFGDLGSAVVVSLLASAAVALFFIPMLAIHTGLGLGVAGTLALVLAGIGFGPAVGQPLAAALGLVLISGFVFSIVVAIMGRLDLDDYTRRATGLWRWSTLQALARAPGVPAKLYLAVARRRRNWIWVFFSPVLVIVGGLLFVLSWIYLLLRFLVGSVLEWAIGKPLLLGLLGAASLVVRFVAPGAGALFWVLLWLPARITGRVIDGTRRAYPTLLRSALARPALVVIAVVACLWGTWHMARTLGSELLPEVHQGEFSVDVSLPVGTPIEETERIVAPIEAAILAEKDRIRSLILTAGYDPSETRRSDEGEHTASFKVLLEESKNPVAQERAVIDALRERFEGVPDLEARIVRPVLFSSKTPIEVEVHGDDLSELRNLADQTAVVMQALPELADVETSLQRGAPEVQIVYDRDRLARYGLNIQQVAQLVRNKVQGFEATRFNLKDRRIPIVVRLAMDDRETVDDVRGIIVNPGGERPIRLASVADVALGEGPSEVRRVDSKRVALISANIARGSLSAATARIENELFRRIEWPVDMGFLISGQHQEWERSRKSLWVALALSVFLVYVIMASQFESLIHPLVIMLTIPLAFLGTIIALKLLGISLSVVVFLGMIMLAGIVVNNAIVLVDYINTLRRRGMERDEAVITAGSVRLRPILMTTATTVLGLTPMALGLGDGAEIRTPMAIAVISGLIASTALTLIVIPTMYVMADRLKMKLSGAEYVQKPSEQPDGGAVSPDTVPS